jgi:cytochrome c1
LTGGDPDHGSKLVVRYGCVGCHDIPGVPGANGLVGPPLEHIASRVYIGGVLLNNPDNLMRWLKNPPSVDPMTAMPATGLSDRDARDIAAYLYTLQ